MPKNSQNLSLFWKFIILKSLKMDDSSDDDQEAPKPVYADITKTASAATIRKRKTTKAWFEEYMADVRKVHSDGVVYTQVEGTPVGYFDEEYLGAFPTYLMSKNISKNPAKEKFLSRDTATTYISCLFTQLRKMYGIRTITKDFVTDARLGVTSVSFEREKVNSANAPPPPKQAPHMTPRDLFLLCSTLLKENTKNGMMMRSEFILQFHTMGRVGESSSLKSSCIKYLDEEDDENQARTIAVTVFRSKRHKIQLDLRLFMHRDSYITCPLHALASFLVICDCGRDIFISIRDSSRARLINAELKRLTEKVTKDNPNMSKKLAITKGLTSHSLRSGPATFANSKRLIQESWVNIRGGWSMKGIDNSQLYKRSTTETDSAVGRVLSEWKTIDFGGSCPVSSQLKFASETMASSRLIIPTDICY